MRIRKGTETRNIFEANDHLQNLIIKMWRTQHNLKFSFGESKEFI